MKASDVRFFVFKFGEKEDLRVYQTTESAEDVVVVVHEQPVGERIYLLHSSVGDPSHKPTWILCQCATFSQ